MSSFIYNRKERFFKFLVLSVSFDGLRFWPTFLVKGSNSALHKKRTKRFFKNPLFAFEDNTLLFILLQTVSSYHERRSRGFVLKLHGNKEGKSRVGDGLKAKLTHWKDAFLPPLLLIFDKTSPSFGKGRFSYQDAKKWHQFRFLSYHSVKRGIPSFTQRM